MNKSGKLVFMLLALSGSAFAQTNASGSFMDKNSDNVILFVVAFGVFVAIVALFYIIYLLMSAVDNLRKEIYDDKGMEWKQQESPFAGIISSLNDAVPIEDESSIDLGHDYDGIRELDNSLPPWWLGLFYATIIISVVYMFYYHVLEKGPLQAEEYEIAMQEAEAQKHVKTKTTATTTEAVLDETTVVVLTDAAAIEKGKALFVQNCVACHGSMGEGNAIGPNLVDEYWIHGGGVNNIFKTIKYGVPAKGMLPWQTQLKPAQIQQVTSYIMSLEGTNPPNAKEAQGDKWVPETAEVPAEENETNDSTTTTNEDIETADSTAAM